MCICLYVYPQVCAKDGNNIEMDSDVSLEIPSGTVIAYSILELEIKKNGHYGELVRACVCVCCYRQENVLREESESQLHFSILGWTHLQYNHIP